MTDEEKAREIAYDDSLYGDSDNNSKTDECYTAAMTMAKYKDAEYDEYIQNVLVFKMLYFIDKEEQRRGLSLDQIEDWRRLRDDFIKYLESQETE